MAIAKITGQGLRAIAVLVFLLWGCIFLEHSMVRRANIEACRALRAIRALQMKRHTEPASVPRFRPSPAPARPALG